MNRKALITIRTSKDGKRCLNSCPHFSRYSDACLLFDKDLRVDDNGAVRCGACVRSTNEFDKLVESNREKLSDSDPRTRDWNS